MWKFYAIFSVFHKKQPVLSNVKLIVQSIDKTLNLFQIYLLYIYHPNAIST